MLFRSAKVAIFDLQDELGQQKAKEIGGLYLKTNVADAANTEASVKEVVAKLGAPRVAVNCAGIGRAARTISKNGPHDLGMFAQVIQVNLIGTFNVIRLASWAMSQAEPMEDGERGVIINTASVAAFDGQIGQAAYSASKGGVVGMTLPIARDLSSMGIRVCTIAPGLFLTPMMMGLSAEDGTRIIPVDAPTLARFEPDWDSAYEECINLRPELSLARKEVKVRQLELINQRNNLLPDLRFTSTYDVNSIGTGLDGPNSDNALRNLASNHFNNWSMGLRLNVPIGFLALFGIRSQMPESRDVHVTRGFDIPGTLTSSCGLAAIVFALIEGQRLGWLMSVANVDVAGVRWPRGWPSDRKSTRLNSSHVSESRMPSSA